MLHICNYVASKQGYGGYGGGGYGGGQQQPGGYGGGNGGGGGGYAAPPGMGGGHAAPPGMGGGGGGYPPMQPAGVSQETQRLFEMVDRDRSGKISYSELKAALINGKGEQFSDTACKLMIGMRIHSSLVIACVHMTI